nr:hypothetical protein CFP56_34954 [Quercus suber]
MEMTRITTVVNEACEACNTFRIASRLVRNTVQPLGKRYSKSLSSIVFLVRERASHSCEQHADAKSRCRVVMLTRAAPSSKCNERRPQQRSELSVHAAHPDGYAKFVRRREVCSTAYIAIPELSISCCTFIRETS